MKMSDIPFATVDWLAVETTRHAGTTGEATWRTRNFADIRVRMVEYSPGYEADHWCQKGHVLLVLAGEGCNRSRHSGSSATLRAACASVTSCPRIQ